LNSTAINIIIIHILIVYLTQVIENKYNTIEFNKIKALVSKLFNGDVI
jgi:hypothetical protein